MRPRCRVRWAAALIAGPHHPAAALDALGFGVLLTGPQAGTPSPKAIKRLKDQLWILTRRSWRVSMDYRIGRLNRFTTGSLGVLELLHDVAFERFTERFCNLGHVWCMLSSLLRALLTMDVQHMQRR